MARLLEAASAAGAEPAEPGEFTLRAYLNGKIDLDRAEAIRDLVEARSDWSARLALGRLEGGGGGELAKSRERVLRLLAEAEAGIDFAESDGVGGGGDLRGRIEEEGRGLRGLLDRAERLVRRAAGMRVVLAGPPNAGKSTLFNRLVGSERALVAPEAGTTRDAVRESITHNGLFFEIVDSAGLLADPQGIDRLAVERSREEIARADLVLVLVDPSRGEVEDRLRLGRELLGERPGFVLLSQQDDGLPGGGDGEGWLAVSAKSGFGVDRLLARLESAATELGGEGAAADWIGEHRRRRVELAADALERAGAALLSPAGLLAAAEHLREAVARLGEASGEEPTEELLREPLSGFCIGK